MPFMLLLSKVPKPLWFVLFGVLLTLAVVVTSYDKGVKAERIKWKLKTEEMVSKQVEEELVQVNIELAKALSLRKEKQQLAQDLDAKLRDALEDSVTLQEQYNEVLKNPPKAECNKLPDNLYRLHVNLRNKVPSVGTDRANTTEHREDP